VEVGFIPPATWLPARVRQINAEGESKIIAVSGSENQSDQKETKVIAMQQQMLSWVFNYQTGIFFLVLLVTGVTASTLLRRAETKCRD
jgi:hypothetical protein